MEGTALVPPEHGDDRGRKDNDGVEHDGEAPDLDHRLRHHGLTRRHCRHRHEQRQSVRQGVGRSGEERLDDEPCEHKGDKAGVEPEAAKREGRWHLSVFQTPTANSAAV